MLGSRYVEKDLASTSEAYVRNLGDGAQATF